MPKRSLLATALDTATDLIPGASTAKKTFATINGENPVDWGLNKFFGEGEQTGGGAKAQPPKWISQSNQGRITANMADTGSEGQMDSGGMEQPAPTPGALGAAGGAEGGGPGAALGGGATGGVIPNVIGPSTAGGTSMTFRSTGTFFLTDDASNNVWSNVPWEFPRLWCQQRGIWEACNKYRYWRTKRITFKVKNPIQRYTYNTGTQTLSQTDSNAKVIVWTDNARQFGIPLWPGWSVTDLDQFTQSAYTGGFFNGQAWYLPIRKDLAKCKLGTVSTNMINGIGDFAPDTEMMQVNGPHQICRCYYPTNKEWRLNHELSQDIWRGEISVQSYRAGQNTQPGEAQWPWVFRADNYSCRSMSRGTHPGSCAPQANANQNIWTTANPMSADYASAVQSLGQTAGTAAFRADQPNLWRPMGTMYAFDSTHLWNPFIWMNEVQERHPQPQLWLTYKNLLGVDGSSILNQKIMLDFEYEWEVEFCSPIIDYNQCGMRRGFDADWDNGGWFSNSFNAKSKHILDPFYYAVPVYTTLWNWNAEGASDNPSNSVKSAAKLIDFTLGITEKPIP